MRRAVIYLRVSTIEQTTANQERELREIALAAWHTGHCQAVRRVSDDGAERRPRLDNEKPRRRWGRGRVFNGRFAKEDVVLDTEPSVAIEMTQRREKW